MINKPPAPILLMQEVVCPVCSQAKVKGVRVVDV